MNEIIGLAPIIGEVCRIFESLSNWMGITKEDVVPLYDYLQKAPSPMDFEKLIVDVVAAMPDAESNPILSGIAANLDSIVRLFWGHCTLSQSDPSWLWKKELADLNRQIEDQAPINKEAKDFYEAKKREYYDYLQRDDCDYVSKATLERGMSTLKNEYDEEKEKLDALTQKYDAVEALSKRVANREMYEIIRKSNAYLDIMTKYMPNIGNSEKPRELTEDDNQEGEYLSRGQTWIIYKFCNDRLFEPTSDVNFHLVFNLSRGSNGLVIKYRQRTKVCVLLGEIAKFVKGDEDCQKKWKCELAKSLGVENICESKYTIHRGKEEPSDPVKEFSMALREILAKLK